jgi:hypothetical protein
LPSCKVNTKPISSPTVHEIHTPTAPVGSQPWHYSTPVDSMTDAFRSLWPPAYKMGPLNSLWQHLLPTDLCEIYFSVTGTGSFCAPDPTKYLARQCPGPNDEKLITF